MRRIGGSIGFSADRRRVPGAAPVLLCLFLAGAPLHAQDFTSGLSPWSYLASPMAPSSWSSLASPMSQPPLSPWSGLGSQMGQSTFPSLSYPYGSASGSQLPGWPDPFSAYRQQSSNTWQQPADSYQPDLTGFWRGSGGESVEVQRNRARIWSGQKQPCSCVFFLVGQRLIAYSPDTDMVRKYWYQGGANQFTLIDEEGNLMTFRRAR